MKYKNLLIILGIISIVVSSCYKEDDWLEDNITEGGKYFPVIPIFKIQDEAQDYYFGTDVVIEMNYFSRDDVASTSCTSAYDGNSTEIGDFPYSSSSYSEENRMDQVLFNYTAEEVDTRSTIDFQGTVTTTNDLDKSTSIVSINTCAEEIKSSYDTKINYILYAYEYDDHGVLESTNTDTLVANSTVAFTKVDDTHYEVDDLGFGLINFIDSDDAIGGVIDRDICHFSGTHKVNPDDDDLVVVFTITGMSYSNREMGFEITIDIYEDEEGLENGIVLGQYVGTSILTE